MTKNQQSKPSIMLRIKKFAFWLKVKKDFKTLWLKVKECIKEAEDTFPKKLPIKRAQFITAIALIASLGLFICFGVYDPCWLYCFLGIETKKEVIEFIGIGIAGLIGLFNVLAVLKRVKAQENMAKAQFENNKSQEKIAEASP